MPQWSWIVWALVSTITNLTKVARITKTINFAQPTLLVEKRATLPENATTTRLDHLLLMFLETHKDIGDARYTLQGVSTTHRHPIDQAAPLTLNQMTTKHPKTLLMFQLIKCAIKTLHHHTPPGSPPGPIQHPKITWNLQKN